MPRREKRVRVERGVYRFGNIYWVCATPPGERTPRWLKLGPVGVQEARRRRDEFAHRVREGGVPQRRRPIRVANVAAEWSAHIDELVACGQLRERTAYSYTNGVRLHVLPSLGGRAIASLTADDLVRWHEAQRRSGAAAWSICARWVGLRSLLAFATRSGPGREPGRSAAPARAPEARPPERSVLTPAEIETLVAHGRGISELVVPLLLFTGLRVSELLGLVWGDIDFDARVIRVRHQMTRKGSKRVPLKTASGGRDVVLMAEVAQRLRKARLAARFSADGGLVVVNSVRNTLGYGRLRQAFAVAARAAGLEDVTPHTCRHTFASILIDQGRDVEFVSRQLGHSNTKTTWDTYVHLFRAREQADAARRDLDAAFGRMLRATDDAPPAGQGA